MRRALSSLGAILLLQAFAASGALAGTAYVAVGETESATPIDTARNAKGTPIPVGKYPAAVAIAPDGRAVYVASYFGAAVTPIDTAAGTAGTPIPIATEDIAIAPDGRSAYVTEDGVESVIPISLPGNLVGTPVKVGKELRDVAFVPDGSTVYAVSGKAKTLTPIDARTGVAGTPIPVGAHPVAVAIVPDGSTAYVLDESAAGMVYPVNLATGTVGAPISAGANPHSIAIAPDGGSAYVTYPAGNSVIPIDLRTGTAGTPIPVGTFPEGIAITPDGRAAYVTNYFGKSVSRVDTLTNTAAIAIEVGEKGDGVAVVPSQPPQPALAIAGTAQAGARLSFDASASRAPFGTIASYAWSFGDGQSASGPKAEHAYGAPGTYRATLTVDNGEGCPGFLYTGHTAYCNGPSRVSASRTVTVAAPGRSSGQPPKPAKAPRVRVSCPRQAGPAGCKLSVWVVSARPRPGSKRRPKAETGVARVKLAAGRSGTVALRPKPAFAAKLATARKALVAVRTKTGAGVTLSYRRLPLIR